MSARLQAKQQQTPSQPGTATQQQQQQQQQQQKRPGAAAAGISPRPTKQQIREKHAVADTDMQAVELLTAEMLPIGSMAPRKQQQQQQQKQRPVRGKQARVDAATAANLPSIVPRDFLPTPASESDAPVQWATASGSSSSSSDA